MEEIPEWAQWVAWGSVVMFVGTLLSVPLLVVRIPSDYFSRDHETKATWTPWQLLRRALRNVIGIVVLFAGVAMLVLPGQGLLTILFAFVLLDVPGKRAIALSIARRRHVKNAMNSIRKRFRRPPLEIPTD